MIKFKYVSQRDGTIGVIGTGDGYKTARWYIKSTVWGSQTVAAMAETMDRDYTGDGAAECFTQLPVAVRDTSGRGNFWT